MRSEVVVFIVLEYFGCIVGVTLVFLVFILDYKMYITFDYIK